MLDNEAAAITDPDNRIRDVRYHSALLAPSRPRPLATTFGLLQRDIDQAPDRLRA